MICNTNCAIMGTDIRAKTELMKPDRIERLLMAMTREKRRMYEEKTMICIDIFNRLMRTLNAEQQELLFSYEEALAERDELLLSF